MTNKQLCLKLIKSETEQEIINILEKEGYWSDLDQWRHYGGIENNFSIIGNQQSSPEAALVEKIINSVDAVLTSECLKRGIHPESEEAPSTTKQAVNDFFNVHGGSLSNEDSSTRSHLSQYISLIATGYKTRPTYTIIDRGEGQYPDDFHDTFLSLAKSNKIKIPFVQGKFNMGGSGVLQFCGEHNLQLIVSRRNDAISQNPKWGFTLVRRQEPPKGYKNSAYTYLAPKGKILTFKADSLDVCPRNYPNPYGEPLDSGTFIKLYEYNMTGGLKTNIKFDLSNRMNLLLPELALPVRLYERRKGYKGQTMQSLLSGLRVRLREDRGNNIEPGFPSSFTFGGFRGEMYVFKPDSHHNYIGNEGVLFVTNGQTQGTFSNSFYNRKRVGMGSLADSILIMVNCDNIDPTDREDLFMNSRDRLRYGDMRSYVEGELEDYVSDHEGLKSLREKRRKERIEETIEDQRPFKEIMQDIIQDSSVLADLFLGQKEIDNPFKRLSKASTEKYEGKQFPTFFEPAFSDKKAHLGQRFRIQYVTDAENDYLTRDNEAGEFHLYHRNRLLDYTTNLWNGFLTVNVILPEGVKEGTTLTLKSQLWDNSRFEPFEHEFNVEVLPEQESPKGRQGNRKKPPSEDTGSHSPFKGKGSLPNIIEVKKDDWKHYGFGKNDCLQIINNGELGYDFAINMDNRYVLTELIKRDDVELTKLKYKYVTAIIGMALIQANAEGQAKDFTKILSPVILPITNLKLEDIWSIKR